SVIARPKPAGFKKRLRAFLYPGNPVSARNIAHLMRLLKADCAHPVVLVVGGGSVGDGTEALYADPDIRVIGFDIYGTAFTQFIADGHHIPLAEESVDAV